MRQYTTIAGGVSERGAPPRRRHARAALLACCLCAASLALLAARLLSPPPRLVDVGAPGDAYIATSFYGPERAPDASFRWSGPNSALAIPAHARRLILSARLHGAAEGQRLALISGGDTIGPWPTTGGWRVYSVLADAAAPGHLIQLYVETVRPGEDDPRELGVALDWVLLRPLPAGADAIPGAVGEAAKIVWGLALAGAALWVALAALSAGPPPGAGAVLLLLSPIVAALLGWAWADPYAVRWLLPLDAGHLAAASVAVGAVCAIQASQSAGAASITHPSSFIPALARSPVRLPGPARSVLAPALVVGAALLLLWSPAPMALRGAAALAILWAPGWLLVDLLLPHERDPAMGFVLRACGALAGQVVILMGLAPLLGGGGALVGWACALASAALAALRGRLRPRRRRTRPLQARQAAAWALVLLVAAGLRLPALGGAELHDDEASVLLTAAALAQGDAEVLLTQLKGPAQILLPAGPLLLTGQLSELTARLPFAAAGLTAVLGAMALARRLFGPGAAPLAAGLLLALDGLLIAFSRIAQYQSLVMALSVGAYWCCWRFARGAPGARRYLAVAALLTAVALLGHYDAIYVLPALLWLVVAGARRRGWGPAAAGRALTAPALLGAGLLAGFYVPFALHPHAAETLGHLGERTGQGGGPGLTNNLASSYALLTVYSTSAQFWAVALLVSALVGAALLRAAGRGWRGAGLAPGLAAAALLAGAGALWAGQPNLALFLLAGGALGAAAMAPTTPAAARPLLLWLGAGWLTMTFLIAQPRTHIYVAAIPAALLAAAAVGRLARPLSAPPLGRLLVAGALAATLWAGLRQHTVFVRQGPEYIRAYPAAHIGAWPGLGDELPLEPAARFGFPSRDGWKAIGALHDRGALPDAVASNQSSEVIAWYMRGQRRCGAEPAAHLVAVSAANPSIPAGLRRTSSVQVDGRDQILIYEGEGARARPRVIALEPYVGPFDERPIPPIPAACLRPEASGRP